MIQINVYLFIYYLQYIFNLFWLYLVVGSKVIEEEEPTKISKYWNMFTLVNIMWRKLIVFVMYRCYLFSYWKGKRRDQARIHFYQKDLLQSWLAVWGFDCNFFKGCSNWTSYQWQKDGSLWHWNIDLCFKHVELKIGRKENVTPWKLLVGFQELKSGQRCNTWKDEASVERRIWRE